MNSEEDSDTRCQYPQHSYKLDHSLREDRMFEIIIFSFKKKLLLFLVLSSLLAAEITSSKYLGDSVFKIFKSNEIHHAVYCLREIQNVIHDKNSLSLSLNVFITAPVIASVAL